MPADDVSDLKDVFDAINRLCETMKASDYEDTEPTELVNPEDVTVQRVETHLADTCKQVYSYSRDIEVSMETWSDTRSAPNTMEVEFEDLKIDTQSSSPVQKDVQEIKVHTHSPQIQETNVLSPETQLSLQTPNEVVQERLADINSSPPFRKIEVQEIKADMQLSSQTPKEVRGTCTETRMSPPSSEEVSIRRVDRERWSDCRLSPPETIEDLETVTSDTEPAMAQCEPISEMYFTASSEVSLLSDTELPDRVQCEEDSDKDDRKECVIAGHVAAMRERFESMTRTNTPCPDLIRSTSPSLDVFRNITPSPDHLG